jgi:hypothetical protein
MSTKKEDRKNSLMPGGIPRYVRCYNQSASADQYTVIFTKKRLQEQGDFMYLGMSANPYDSQGICQHGFMIDAKVYSHLGKKIGFSDLPNDCREIIIKEYIELWDLN